jgi:NADPH:quinone reductase-like Zn-dependent oxidoreductase
MRAAGITEFGGAVTTLDLPPPRQLVADEVLIDVVAAGVGNWDDFVRAGSWDVGRHPPMALGVEATGIITGIGNEAGGLEVGHRVLLHTSPFRDQGAWADKLIAPAGTVAHKPVGVAWEVAAAFSVPALTAEQVLDALAVSHGEVVLVHGAGGVTGGLIVQLAATKGVTVLATAGPASAERVRSLGAVAVFDYRDPAWSQQARQRAGAQGVAAAVNAARGGAATALGVVAPHGRLATITGDPPAPERGINVFDIYVRPDGARLKVLAGLLGDGVLSLSVSRVYPLEEASRALHQVVSGGAAGAIVVNLETAPAEGTDAGPSL